MKAILTQILVLCTTFTFAQYQVGVPVQDTIYTGQYTSFDQCAPNADVSIELDGALHGFVTGLEVMLVITAIDINQGELSNTHGVVNTGDEMIFTDSDEFFTFYFSNTGHFEFVIIAKGTPEVAEEKYPCAFEGLVSQALCQNGYIIQPHNLITDCTVAVGVTSTFDNPMAEETKIFPNPTSGIFTIQQDNISELQSIEVFNQLGQLVLKKEGNLTSNETLNITSFDSGSYLVKFNTGEYIYSKMLVKY